MHRREEKREEGEAERRKNEKEKKKLLLQKLPPTKGRLIAGDVMVDWRGVAAVAVVG